MSEQFSVSQLQDEVSMYEEFVEIPVTAQGKEYIVKMYPFFKPEKVRDLVDEMIEFFKVADKEKVEVKPIEEDDLIGYFVIKYFTDMKFTKSKKAKSIYNEFKLALNSQLFKVLMETYPEESIKSVHERIYAVRDASLKFGDKIKEVQELVKNMPLENRDILEKLNLDNKVVQ
jgi:DNA uptake protein ComE-like DNA-binding protein